MSEVFTGRKGRFVNVKDNIAGFKGISKFDQLIKKRSLRGRATTIPKPHSIWLETWKKPWR